MKKILFYSLLLAGCLSMTTACSNDDNESEETTTPGSGGSDQGDNGTPTTVSTAEDAQREFDRVGQAFLNKIDADKFKPVITLAQYCLDTFVDRDAVDREPDEVIDSPDYDGTGWTLKNIMSHISSTAKGDFAGVAVAKRIVETYSFSDYTGIFTWNEYMEKWDEESATDELVYKFNHEGKPCVVTVKTNGTEHTWAIKNEQGTTTEYVKVPASLTATVTENGTTLASFNLNVPQCDQNGKSYSLNAQLKVSDYTIAGEVTNNNNTAKATYSMLLNDEKLLDGTAEVNGSSLADDDMFIRDEFEKENLKKGTATCSILSSINLNIQADNTNALLLDALNFDGCYYRTENGYGNGTPYIYQYSDKETAEREAREAAGAANSYLTSNITFAQGDYTPRVEWEAYITEEYNYSWGTEGYGSYGKSEKIEWAIRPVIVFDNDGRYSFENYFSDSYFNSLASIFWTLMDDFEKLVE